MRIFFIILLVVVALGIIGLGGLSLIGSPNTSVISKVQCDGFTLQLKEWVSHSITGTHTERYYWYQKDGLFSKGKRIAWASFPSPFAPEDFQWFEQTTTITPSPSYTPVNLILYEAASDMPASLLSGDIGTPTPRFGFFSQQEYIATRDCLADKRSELVRAVTSWYQDRSGEGQVLPVRIASISFLPFHSVGDGWGVKSPSFSCPNGSTLSLHEDSTVRMQPGDLPIGRIDQLGVFTEDILDSRPERIAKARVVLDAIDRCVHDNGLSLENFFAQWRQEHAAQFRP